MRPDAPVRSGVALLACLFATTCLVVASTGSAATNEARRHGVTFGHHGKKTLRSSPGVTRVLAYRGERLLLLGRLFGQGNGLARLRVNGSPDPSFGKRGFLSQEFASDAAVLPNGRILVVGSSAQMEVTIARLLPGGRLDRTFGRAGVRTVDFDAILGGEPLIGIAPDGRIVIATATANTAGRAPTNAVPLLVRLLPDGSLDHSFAGDGFAKLPTFGSVADIAVQPDGGILADLNGEISRGLVLRLRSDGSRDGGFGEGGALAIELPAFSGDRGFFHASEEIAALPDGRFYVAGTVATGEDSHLQYSIGAARYTSDGKLDGSFGDGGVVQAGFPGESFADALAVQGGSRLVVAGSTYIPDVTNSAFAAVCFRSDGRLEARFGSSGKARIGFRGWARATAVVAQPRRAVTLLGVVNGSGRARTALARLRVRRTVR